MKKIIPSFTFLFVNSKDFQWTLFDIKQNNDKYNKLWKDLKQFDCETNLLQSLMKPNKSIKKNYIGAYNKTSKN